MRIALIGFLILLSTRIDNTATAATSAKTDFLAFLLGQPVVIEGTLASLDTAWRSPSGGACDARGLGPYRLSEATVRVDRVLLGIAEDRTLRISVLGNSGYPPGPLHRGARVIAWAYRDCTDDWRLWGGFDIVDYEGNLMRSAFRGRVLETRFQARALEETMARAMGHGTRIFEGAPGVALMRITEISGKKEGGFRVSCDSIGWVMGSGVAPRVLDGPSGNCSLMQVGDTLLVPSSWRREAALHVPRCADVMAVRSGFAPGLGVPLALISRALSSDATGVHVNAYIAQKPVR